MLTRRRHLQPRSAMRWVASGVMMEPVAMPRVVCAVARGAAVSLAGPTHAALARSMRRQSRVGARRA